MRKLVLGIGVNDADYVVKPTINGYRLCCPFYERWRNMITRCYDPKFHKKYPTYIDCEVCYSWLSFSNFRSWMVSQNWQGLELDKDIIFYGNKLYSPKTCCFITQALNSLLVDRGAARGKYPRGVYFNKKSNKFLAQVMGKEKSIYLGMHMTQEAASNAYIKAKIRLILEAANEQSDPRIANGLRLHAKLIKAM